MATDISVCNIWPQHATEEKSATETKTSVPSSVCTVCHLNLIDLLSAYMLLSLTGALLFVHNTTNTNTVYLTQDISTLERSLPPGFVMQQECYNTLKTL